jgi:hypothetical protein
MMDGTRRDRKKNAGIQGKCDLKRQSFNHGFMHVSRNASRTHRLSRKTFSPDSIHIEAMGENRKRRKENPDIRRPEERTFATHRPEKRIVPHVRFHSDGSLSSRPIVSSTYLRTCPQRRLWVNLGPCVVFS